MSFARGDVVIALFPSADASASKPRPVLVIQSDIYNVKIRNLVVAAITSNLKHAGDPASLLIDVSTADGQASGLVSNSLVSCINLATIDDSLIAKKIGHLSQSLQSKVDACLKVALALF